MPLELDASGLNIQPLSEIKTELEDAFRAEFGENINVDPDSVFGQIIGIVAEREATLQQLLQALFASFNPLSATGVGLDAISAITSTERKPATKSQSTSGLATGTPATVLTDGRQVRLIQTNELWEIVNGPFVIGGGGTIAVDIRAVETGPKTFQTTGPSGWSIETPVAGWTSFETTADLDPEDTGRDIESEEELRQRRKDELSKNGNDLDAIRAALIALVGVTEVAVFENVDCTQTVDGIPPGAFEVVIEGGTFDPDIAQIIFDNKPPGAESFGTNESTTITTTEGQDIDIEATRPSDVDIFVEVTVGTLGAEADYPVNGNQLIEDALLVALNATTKIGRDVIPQAFTGVVFDAVKVDGIDSIISAVVGMSTSALGPFLEVPIPITNRERSDFDSANIDVVVV